MHDLLTIEVAACLDQGQVREEQEDYGSAWTQDKVAFLVVADGMGGHTGGAIASRLAVEAVEQALRDYLTILQIKAQPVRPASTAATNVHLAEQTVMATHKLPETVTAEHDAGVAEVLRNAVHAAQTAIQAAATTQPAASEAGSTLTVALIFEHRAHIAHVGDSRAYHWQQSTLHQLTHDHSAAALLVAAGAITAAAARHHPERSVLYQFLGITTQPLVIEIVHEPLAAGELLLLCSDGLWGMVPDEEIAALIGPAAPLVEIAQTLIDTAKANGGEDNIAVALARVA